MAHDHESHEHDHGSHAHDHGSHAHGHGHAHDHGHHGHAHSHEPGHFGRAFAIAVAANLAYVGAEVVYGILADSVALLADAAHNLGDVLALLMAWAAVRLSKRLPSPRFTYGLRKSSILAALANASVLFFVTGAIAWEALQRIENPVPVEGLTVVWVAALGIVVNAASAALFRHGSHDLNVRAAFLHLAGDAAISAGVVLSGLVVMRTGWNWLDPAVSLAVSVAIVLGSWSLLRGATRMALDAVPDSVDSQEVRGHLAGLGGVCEVHDLHIWPMSTTETALTAHLVMPAGHPGDHFLADVSRELHHRFRIHHCTFQIEIDVDHPCELAPDDVV